MTSTSQTAWDATLSIMEKLRQEGYIALLAGGCVRDRLLGRTPKDYDIATNARPEQVRALFPKARLVGAKFGVVIVRRGGHNVEVATFRSEGAYSDGRHPDEVSFGDEREDALRRDFTINGLFYDPFADRVVDYVGGQEDLARRVIRTIGPPDARFSEDHLRMLRAVRLSARLGFPIEAATLRAITSHAPRLEAISPERVWMELEQILIEPTRSRGWTLLMETGLRAYLSADWPIDPARDELSGRRLGALPPQPVEPALALSAALPDATPSQCDALCRSLRLSNHVTGQILWLADSLPLAYAGAELELADFKFLRAHADWALLLELLRIDLVARDRDLDVYERARARAESMTPEEAAPAPLVTGDDLLELGYLASPAMGAVLRAVYRAQLNEAVGSKDDAMALACRLAGQPQ